MFKKSLFAVLISSTLLFTSCATIFTGSKRKVTFETNPSGATLFVNGIERCTTPCDYKVSGDDNIRFGLDGYKERVIVMDTKFNLVSILNGFSIIGWGVDAITGSLQRVDTNYVKIGLEENEVALLDKALSTGNITRVDIDTENKVIETVIVLSE